MHNVVIKIGRLRVVALITLASVIASVLITFILMAVFTTGLDLVLLAVSIITPSIVAPLASWYIVGLMFRIHKLEQVQRDLATYDVLTRVMTRRKFLENSEALLKLMAKENMPMSFAYIDLDNFKLINDSYGHAGGDEVLKSFASVVQNHLRKSDLVGRIGGEEFAIALPNTGLDKSIRLLEKIRHSSENNPVEYSSEAIQYTISIGVVLFHDANPVCLDRLSHQSDLALYNAKQSGKNCIVEYETMKVAA